MSNEIQQTRYDRLIRRVAGIIGPGSKVSEVITELFPTIDLENVPAELLVLGGTAIAFRGTNLTSPAGERNASQLSNPAGSGKIITVSQVTVSMSAGGDIFMTLAHPLLASVNGFGQFRDARAAAAGGGAAVGSTRIEFNVTVTPIITFLITATRVFSFRDDNAIAVLLPGDQLTISSSNLNVTLQVGYFWRERAAEQSELSI